MKKKEKLKRVIELNKDNSEIVNASASIVSLIEQRLALNKEDISFYSNSPMDVYGSGCAGGGSGGLTQQSWCDVPTIGWDDYYTLTTLIWGHPYCLSFTRKGSLCGGR